MLSLNNVALAETAEKKPDAEEFKQAKANTLQGASNHIEALTKFKSCVEAAKTGPDLGACQKNKNNALKEQKMKNKQVRVKKDETKKTEAKPSKPTE
jgi:hypothetical protein